MARWFQLELDTQAPQVTWGDPIGGEPGQLLTIPYVINEPEIVSATIRDAYGRVFELEVGATELTGTMPVDQYAGPAEVRALVKDDVFNEGTEFLSLVLSGQVVQDEQEGGGISREFTQIGGPAFVYETERFSGEVSSATKSVERFSGAVSNRILLSTDTQRFQGVVRSSRRDAERFSGEREGNVTLAQVRREDDEILALL